MTQKSTGRGTTRASTRLARAGLLTLGVKKATELWQARREPPSPSLIQRLAIPARVVLATGGVGAALYVANKRGMLTPIKRKLRPERKADVSLSGTGVEAPVAPAPIQPSDPPPSIVDTHPPASVGTGPAPSPRE
jgi:hypothetical protein